MARFEISVSAGYVPGWGLQEGIREVFQNSRDEEERCPQHPMQASYTSRGNGHLNITTVGVTLDRAVLLLGETTKVGTRARGQFGEGLSLALLALVRAGHDVRIENGDESWLPSLRYSEQWGRELLVVDTRALGTNRNHFKVEIQGVFLDDWEEVKRRTLFLPGALPKNEKVLRVGDDTVLLKRPGDVYAKGLWVGRYSDLAVGYDLDSVQLDRDRKLVDYWDLRYKLGELWGRALECEESATLLVEHVGPMLAADTPDVGSLRHAIGARAKAALVGGFTALHGDEAVPVRSTEEAEKVEAAGLTAVIVSRIEYEVLEASFGKSSERRIKEAFEGGDVILGSREIHAEGLTGRFNYLRVLAERLGIDADLSVVRFKGDRFLGQYRYGDLLMDSFGKEKSPRAQVWLAESLLKEDAPGKALVTLCHEGGHAAGGDLTLGHRSAEERLLSQVIDLLCRGRWS